MPATALDRLPLAKSWATNFKVIVSVEGTAYVSIERKMRSRLAHNATTSGVGSSPLTTHGGTPHDCAVRRTL
jgi:hypothetical protein